MVKNANFRGLRRIWDFLPTLRGIMLVIIVTTEVEQ